MTELRRYKGSHTHYQDVASKGNLLIGLGVDYAVHPVNGTGYIAIRFVARHVSAIAPDFDEMNTFTHFTNRDKAQFVFLGGDKNHQTIFNGYRLNKVLLPAFKPAPCGHQIGVVGDSHNLWLPITEWIAGQLVAEGFTPLLSLVDLASYVRDQVVGPAQPQPVLVLEFSDLPPSKPAKPPKVKKPKDDDEDGDDGEDDEDWGKVN